MIHLALWIVSAGIVGGAAFFLLCLVLTPLYVGASKLRARVTTARASRRAMRRS
jgi:hypothetical protein